MCKMYKINTRTHVEFVACSRFALRTCVRSYVFECIQRTHTQTQNSLVNKNKKMLAVFARACADGYCMYNDV